jgi:hypothetical protein
MKQLLPNAKKDPAFKAEYAALEQEFAMFDELLKARLAALPDAPTHSRTDSGRV